LKICFLFQRPTGPPDSPAPLDLTAVKKRPGLIISPIEFVTQYADVVILALTGQPQPLDVERLTDWKSAGLLKETWLKPLIGTVSAGIIERRLGRLTADDFPRVTATLARLISPTFRR